MVRFYDLWRNDGLPALEALWQAQIWLRDSTTEYLKRTFKDFIEFAMVRMSGKSVKVFYAHIEWEDPDSHPFSHPFYWAAFSFTGM